MITINDKFYTITKVSNPNEKTGKLEIEVKFEQPKDYNGYDVFPDDMIGDLIIAVGLHFKRKKSWDRIKRKFNNT